MSLAATGQPEKHEPFQPLPEGFRHVVWNDLDEFEKSLTPEVGGVILEPVQSQGGVNPADVEYLQGVRHICDERGLLLVLDEIQTGFGRTGHWFGFQAAGIRPDVVTMAKGIANGMPVGAIWACDEVAAAFVPGDHGSTFAGQPLALAAARATIAELEAIDAPAAARRQYSDCVSTPWPTDEATMQSTPQRKQTEGSASRGAMPAAPVFCTVMKNVTPTTPSHLTAASARTTALPALRSRLQSMKRIAAEICAAHTTPQLTIKR